MTGGTALRTIFCALALASACADETPTGDGGVSDVSTIDAMGRADAATSPDASDAGVSDAVAGDAVVTPRPEVGYSVIELERPVDLTPDGRTALLWQQSTGELYFYDTVDKTLTVKTTLDLRELQNQQPHALSANLRIAAGYGFQPGEAGLWSEPSGWLKLGTSFAQGCVDSSTPTPNVLDLGTAFDVSADGTTAVGFLWEGCSAGQAFRWRDSGGRGTFTMLARLGGVVGFERATVVSADGRVAAGFAPQQVGKSFVDRSPARWLEDGTGMLLDPGNANEPGEVTAISADGAVMAGIWASTAGGINGFVWTATAGVTRLIPPSTTPEFESVFVNAMSANGKFILGAISTFDPNLLSATQRAFAWSAAGGFQTLADLAVSVGITLGAGQQLTNVLAVSADGTTILGEVTFPPDPNDPLGLPVTKIFVLVLPASAVPR